MGVRSCDNPVVAIGPEIWEIRMTTRRFTVCDAPRGRFERGTA
jgi:hypothetical protein